MPNPTTGKKSRALVLIVLAGLVLLAVLAGVRLLTQPAGQPPAPAGSTDTARTAPPGQPGADAAPGAVIDYSKLGSDEALKAMMAERKEALQVGEGIDIIARSDETLKIGENKVSMREIQDQIKLQLGEISEQNLGPDGKPVPGKVELYGVYVVQPGDNLWNIHFRFLQDHFRRHGVELARTADEPNQKGYSSGVGKLLKFSENVVYIYNLKDRQFSDNLNLLEPQTKIVVYKMDRVFDLLQQINYQHLDRIAFDGDTLWVTTGQ
jgi:hypothetical protein